jgi:hypothetical protein
LTRPKSEGTINNVIGAVTRGDLKKQLAPRHQTLKRHGRLERSRGSARRFSMTFGLGRYFLPTDISCRRGDAACDCCRP